jgi:hypothetical protein
MHYRTAGIISYIKEKMPPVNVLGTHSDNFSKHSSRRLHIGQPNDFPLSNRIERDPLFPSQNLCLSGDRGTNCHMILGAQGSFYDDQWRRLCERNGDHGTLDFIPAARTRLYHHGNQTEGQGNSPDREPNTRCHDVDMIMRRRWCDRAGLYQDRLARVKLRRPPYGRLTASVLMSKMPNMHT